MDEYKTDSSGSRLQQMAITCELRQNTVHLPCIAKVKYKLWTLVCGLYYYLIYCQPRQIVTCWERELFTHHSMLLCDLTILSDQTYTALNALIRLKKKRSATVVECMNVSLLQSNHWHVLATHVANFRVVGTRIQLQL